MKLDFKYMEKHIHVQVEEKVRLNIRADILSYTQHKINSNSIADSGTVSRKKPVQIGSESCL